MKTKFNVKRKRSLWGAKEKLKIALKPFFFHRLGTSSSPVNTGNNCQIKGKSKECLGGGKIYRTLYPFDICDHPWILEGSRGQDALTGAASGRPLPPPPLPTDLLDDTIIIRKCVVLLKVLA